MAVRASTSYSSGRFCRKRILFGGRYSSGTTAAVVVFDERKPAPRTALIWRAVVSAIVPAAAAAILSFLASSAASAAFFLSDVRVSDSSTFAFHGTFTFLGQASSLVCLELLVVTSSFDGCVASCLREGQLHRLIKELESLDFVYGLLGGLNIVENNESLTLGFQVSFGDNIDDFTIFGKELAQSFLQLLDLDSLFEIAHVHPVSLVSSVTDVSLCNDTYVALGGGLGVAIANLVY